jgi:hypothetical protein
MTHVRHERSDISVSGVVAFAVALTTVCVVIVGAIRVLNMVFAAYRPQPVTAEYPLAADSLRRLPPEPRLQTDPRDDLKHLRDAEDRVLESYGWVDRDAGVVRIPIDQAMRLVVERGLPARPEVRETSK